VDEKHPERRRDGLTSGEMEEKKKKGAEGVPLWGPGPTHILNCSRKGSVTWGGGGVRWGKKGKKERENERLRRIKGPRREN